MLALAAFVGCAMFATVPKAPAQIAVEIGVAPECPYGYYDAAPYELCPLRLLRSGMVHRWRFPRCRSMVSWSATTSEDTSTIVFIPNTVIADRTPQRGEKAEPSNRLDKVAHFKGNEVRDGRGHAGGGKH